MSRGICLQGPWADRSRAGYVGGVPPRGRGAALTARLRRPPSLRRAGLLPEFPLDEGPPVERLDVAARALRPGRFEPAGSCPWVLSFGTVDTSSGSSSCNEHGIGRRRTCDRRFLTSGLHGRQPCPATPWVRPPPAVLERFVSRSIAPIPAHPTFVRRPVLDRRREGVGQDGDNRGNGRPDRHTYPSTEHPADGSGD